MRRLIRWTFNFAAAAAAVLFVGVCVLWVRSYRVSDYWDRERPYSRVMLASVRGEIGWERVTWVADVGVGRILPPGYSSRPAADTPDYKEPPPAWSLAGLRWTDRDINRGVRVRCLEGPDWMPFAAAAPLPLLWLLTAWRRHHPRPRGLCPACGYDLRATPGRCPECGAVPTQA